MSVPSCVHPLHVPQALRAHWLIWYCYGGCCRVEGKEISEYLFADLTFQLMSLEAMCKMQFPGPGVTLAGEETNGLRYTP